jgi:hypothetical protein
MVMALPRALGKLADWHEGRQQLIEPVEIDFDGSVELQRR